MARQVIKDIHLELRMFPRRVAALVLMCVLLVGALVARMVHLQVIGHAHYSDLATDNRVRLSPIPPTRGLIYDRRGVLLADNLPAFNLEIVPEQVEDLPNLLGRLGEVIELSEDDIQRFERLRRRSPAYRSLPIKTNLSEAEVARFMVARHRFDGVSVQARLQRHYPFGARFAHLLGYVGRINERELKRLDARNYRATTHIGKTGIEKYYESLLHGTVGVREDEVNSHGRRIRVIRETPPRPGESLVLSVDARLQAVATAALAGRSGAVVALDPRNGEVLALVSEPDFDPNHIGKTGIEKYYESLLHGTVGVREDEVNSHGRRIRVIRETPPRPGESLVLSVDARLQAVATAALAGRSGAVVALDPRNGEVLALVSEPDFDPNLFVNGISRRDYARLRDDRERPLFNRALRGQYPPGSTVKPIVALAGLEAGVITPERRMFAGPYYELPGGGRRFRDWRKGGHGWVDLDRAIVRSCDVYFYDLSYRLGIDRLHDIYGRFGLGRPTGIDLPGELGGLLPSREWKRRRHKQAWYPGETVILGIGQGYLLATPLQLATMTGCIAMRGDCHRPHLLKARIASAVPADTGQLRGWRVTLRDPRHWDVIIDAMRHVVSSPEGTGRRIADAPYSIAGKTGTAQVFSLKEDEEYKAEKLARHMRDHAWFVGFAPVEDPRIAVAVIVEHAGHGGSVAAPVARRVMDAWLLGDKPAAGLVRTSLPAASTPRKERRP